MLTFTCFNKRRWSTEDTGSHSRLLGGLMPFHHGDTVPGISLFHVDSNLLVHALQEGCWYGKHPATVTSVWLDRELDEGSETAQTL